MTDMTLFAPAGKGLANTEEGVIYRLLLRGMAEKVAQPHALVRCCESPIERIMAWALLECQASLNGEAHFCHMKTPDELLGLFDRLRQPALAVLGCPQACVGPYRLDFLLVTRVGRDQLPYFLAVECDGHAFHEKTKEQAARDKARDRALIGMGIQTARFTGSEIWRDPEACADAVYEILSQAEQRYWTEGEGGR